MLEIKKINIFLSRLFGAFILVSMLLYSVVVLAEEQIGEAKGFSFNIPDAQGNKKATIAGDSAQFLPNGIVELNNVLAVFHRQDKVEIKTQKAFFDKEKNQVYTDNFVEVEAANLKVSGTGAKWNPQSEEIEIQKNVKILLKNGTVVTSDSQMTVDYDKKVAYLTKNVVIETKGGKLLSDKAEVYFSDIEGGVKRVKAIGSVKILYEGKNSTSEIAEYFTKNEKLVLTGNPQIRKGKNLYTAEKIVIFSKENRVEFKPKAKLIISYDKQNKNQQK